MLTARAIGPEGFRDVIFFKFTKTRQHIAPPLFDPAWIFVIPSDLNEV